MGPTKVFRARHVAPDSIRGSFGLTDTRNTTHGSGESASPVHSHKQEDGLGSVGGPCAGVESQVFPVSFSPSCISGLCGFLSRCGPRTEGQAREVEVQVSEPDSAISCLPSTLPVRIPSLLYFLLQTLWFQPVERLQPSSLTSVSSAGTRKRSPSCAVAPCATVPRAASTAQPDQEALDQPDAGLWVWKTGGVAHPFS